MLKPYRVISCHANVMGYFDSRAEAEEYCKRFPRISPRVQELMNGSDGTGPSDWLEGGVGVPTIIQKPPKLH